MGLFSWILSPIIDKRIAAFQSDLMGKHVTEVENIYRQMRGWRHDYHNHIQTVKAHLKLEQYNEIGSYLDMLDTDLTTVDTVIKTGNLMVDAILNSKISIAMSKQINVNAKAIVPRDLPISEIDLCVIIGNLFDNATEACVKLPNETDRFIRIYIDVFKGQLYISISNSVGGEVKKRKSDHQSNDKGPMQYITTKEKDSHGFGLMRVDKIAQKYGGFVNRQNEDGVFATEIMLSIR